MAERYRQIVGIETLDNIETYSVMINYDTSFVVVSEEIRLTTLPNFISSVGGNLGLFIGFSVLPVLLQAIDYFRNVRLINLLNVIGNR